MKITIIGIGNLGSAIANALVLTQEGLLLALYEPYKGNKARARAEWGDLYPVAVARGNKVLWEELRGRGKLHRADAYIITAGKPRDPKDTNKKEWMKRIYGENLGIVLDVVKRLPENPNLFVATNPPKEIVAKLREMGYRARELRTCTDRIRLRHAPNGFNRDTLNNLVIGGKGFTAFTPAYAIAREVAEAMQ